MAVGHNAGLKFGLSEYGNIVHTDEVAPPLVTIRGLQFSRSMRLIFHDLNIGSKTFKAVVKLDIRPECDTIPDVTFTKKYVSGLSDEQYVGLDPGGGEDYLKQGDFISFTQSVLVLEEIVGQFLFNKAEKNAFE